MCGSTSSACIARARRLNPRIGVIRVSATSGEGMAAWYGWLLRRRGDVALSGGDTANGPAAAQAPAPAPLGM